MGDQWTELPADVLMTIHDNLVHYADKFRFRYVCTHWQSSSPEPLLQQPWLLLPYAAGSICGLYHPLEKKVYEVDLSGGGDYGFIGSGHGWVVTLHIDDGSINVVNPISGTRVPLPSKHLLFDKYNSRNRWVDKIAISCSPNSDDFRAVALYYSTLAYCKAGDKMWHDMGYFDDNPGHIINIAFSDGKLYAINGGVVLVCDDIVSCPKLRKYHVSFPIWYSCKDHLINSQSDGIMILPRKARTDTSYAEYEYYKLDLTLLRWVPMERQSDQVFLVGLNGRMGISYRATGENQVYFAKDEIRYNIGPLEYKIPYDTLHIDWFTSDDIFPYSKLNVSSLTKNFPTKRKRCLEDEA